MEETCQILRSLRKQKGLSLRKVAPLISVDVAILSKIERGERKLTKSMLLKLAGIYEYSYDELLVCFLADRIIMEVKSEVLAERALKKAMEKVAFPGDR